MPEYKNRIVELTSFKASELVPHEKNPRLHPEEQKSALAGAMKEIGFASPCLVYMREGKPVVIDGHLRRDLLGNQEIPCIVLDLEDYEADKLLATHDALSALANIDYKVLADLTDKMWFESESVSAMIQNMLEDAAPLVPTERDEVPHEPEPLTTEGETHGLFFSGEQWVTISAAITKFRQMEDDETVSGSTAVEMLLASWLAGAPK